MAHHEEQPTAIESVLELLNEHGLGAMAEAMQTLLNEAMKIERGAFLRASPGERTDERTGYASVSGVSLHANAAVSARDRQRLERLSHYAARPPVATDRLSRMDDGRLLAIA